MDNSKFKKRVSVFKVLHYLIEVKWDIFDLPFVRNKDYQY